jgi:hypothetical protein
VQRWIQETDCYWTAFHYCENAPGSRHKNRKDRQDCRQSR